MSTIQRGGPPILRRHVAEGVANRDGVGFVARYGFPGGAMRTVFVEEGQPAIFRTREAAENEARRVLVESLNRRELSNSRDTISEKMTANEFAAALAETGISPSAFADLWGTKPSNVMDWISGAKEVPFAMRWVLDLLEDEENREEAIRISTAHTRMKPEEVERRRRLAENKGGQDL